MTIFKRRMGINNNIPIIFFRPEPYNHNRIERQTEIDQLKKSGQLIVILSQGDGWTMWNNELCVSDGEFGHE